MGVNIKELVIKHDIAFSALNGKKVAVDSFNILYQFLSTIRQRDGSLLVDSNGNVTSHLAGLFSRTTRLMEKGMKMAFVFDGKAPELKEEERARRAKLKREALMKKEEAEKSGDIEEMKKYASRTSVLTPEMVGEAKLLIKAMGMPVIQAPCEGEAQAAYMVLRSELYAEISQDYDCLLFGVPRMVQNLTITPRKKLPNKLAYEAITPQLIELKETLDHLGIDRDQLIALGLLVGTDFNVGGVKGIGPKNALKLVKQHGKDFDKLFKEAKWDEEFPFPWKEPFDLIKNMPTTDDYKLEWKPLDKEKVIELLVEKHDFSKERVEGSLEKLEKEKEKYAQKGLGDFLRK
ncbi:MAG: flap endonuclease-1 [Nanoarchaeota archaeon]|nr:flap endonuclease-1 [Nanoarchaeota archaeon]